MHSPLLSLLSEKVDPALVKRVSGAKGGEYHSPCPLCGGDDRFMTFPEQDGGDLCQKHGIQGRWACRQCGLGGDVLTWFMKVEGMRFKDACAELRIDVGEQPKRRDYRPLRMPVASGGGFVPVCFAPPAPEWRAQATQLALEANGRLLATPAILRYLERRGLPDAAVRAYRLGYIEAEGKATDCIFRARSAFGLPEKQGRDGKPVRALRIPRGVTIPCWGGAGGDECWRIRIRRRDADRDRLNPKDPKYLLVPQPGQPYSAPMILPPVDVSPDLATWVIVEAELDAMAVHHACGGKIGVVSILSVRVKPDAAAHALLARAARILVALDVDQDKVDGSNPGADAWPWWEQTYPQARLWPVPEGKDPGEALEFGVDLAAWVFAGVPRQSASAPAPAPSPAPDTVTADPSPMQRYRRWPVPDVADFFDVPLPCAGHVNHGNLISAFKRYPFGHERCIVPCPKPSGGGSGKWWWRSEKYCRRCSGHPQCLLGLLNSQLFKEALENA